MVFSSVLFIYIFMPVVLFATYSARGVKAMNWVLLVASLVFFSCGAPRFVFALVAFCAFDYVLSRFIAARPGRCAKALCFTGVAANLAVLAFFKYTGFAVDSVNAILKLLGVGATLNSPGILLPLGISFFTFQKISYIVDVYRGVSKPAGSFPKYLLYIALFPQLILGPIIRYHEIEAQFDDRRIRGEDVLSGIWRFSIGLARKTLLAGPLAVAADAAFNSVADGHAVSTATAWLGLYAYTLQIYFDFAGYSDMAVGIGRMLGFRFPENFNAPYISRNMAEFWRRWHMTLGGFMKEYLYIPLGGNRCSRARSLFNNWLVFIVSGFWHGASWNFVVWGAWHGLWITISKLFGRRLPEHHSVSSIPAVAFTFLMAMLGWVFFRAGDFSEAAAYFKCLFANAPSSVSVPCDAHATAALAGGTFFAFAPAVLPRLAIADWRLAESDGSWQVAIRGALAALLIILSTLPLLASGFNPFIYFRF